ncbi:type II and III secretion system protein family protein [Nitrosococcus wardiae]|uniref:Type II and III secretion system protein family protein n=1 Tax=Nitrosococcus wardiae TaxID=1814290 RepID=A0A4P7C2C6_9GAMM|nr:type II and III secretion system protein family protein [Nitrosococcus wardiae]QBQ55879.1 type II and III secretion system protein family protein [Nitrosococcus wardiae]
MSPQKNHFVVGNHQSWLCGSLLLAINLIIFFSLTSPVLAQTSPLTPRQSENLIIQSNIDGDFQVPLYKSGVIELEERAKRISVGNPGIADILMLHSRQLYVVGKALGTTNVVVWDNNERVFASFNIEVVHDLDMLKRKLHRLLPGEVIEVHSAQERIILSGQVSSVVKMKAAEDLAQGFLPECISAESNVLVRDTTQGTPIIIQQGEGGRGASGANQEGCKKGSVVNLMQVGGAHQVMLEIKVAEIARTVLKRFDSNFNVFSFDSPWKLGANSGGASFPNALTPSGNEVPILGSLNGEDSPIGPVVDLFQPNTPGIQDKGVFLSYLSSKFFLEAVLEASRQKGLAKVLAEPTLTTLTGQEAQFVSGGEFPIPVPQSGITGNVTIEFKEFGVIVKFLPLVLDSGRINLKLNVAVSELSQDVPVTVGVQGTESTFVIPSLTKRSAKATVELADGQTIGIAGLINDNLRELVTKLPGLGDVPILGALFRSQEFMSGQTELVMFVTPHLARPISPQQVKLPTDSFVPPTDLEFYLMGRMEAREMSNSSPSSQGIIDIGPESHRFGHQL